MGFEQGCGLFPQVTLGKFSSIWGGGDGVLNDEKHGVLKAAGSPACDSCSDLVQQVLF